MMREVGFDSRITYNVVVYRLSAFKMMSDEAEGEKMET